MIRAIVAVLMVANVAFWAWTMGWLDGVVGHPASGDREPERVSRQVNPETIKLGAVPAAVPAMAALPAAVPAASAAPAVAGNAASAAASAAVAQAAFGPDCLEAGPLSPENVEAAEAVLARAALPTDSWSNIATDVPGQWWVYMGRFADAEQLARKEDELKRLRVVPERVGNAPDLQPGLVLGRYASRSLADDALGLLQMRGVKSARVVAFAEPHTTHVLRFEKPNAALKAQMSALKVAFAALGSGLVRCGSSAAAPPVRTP